MTKKRIILLIIIVVGIIAAYRIGDKIYKYVTADKKEDSGKIIPVKAIGVKVSDMSQQVKFTGNIVGKEVVSVFSQVGGKIHTVYIKQGDFVSKGQSLFLVDRDIIGMEYNLAKVEAPISGYIGRIDADRGMTIAPTMPLAQVVNMSSVEAVINLMEENINKVNIGMKARIKVSSQSDKYFYGVLYKKSAVLDPISRTQEARIKIENPDLQLRHGMFADIEIITDTKYGVLAIPTDAIISSDGSISEIYKVVNNKAVLTKITIGVDVNNQIEVLSGLADGDVIITLGADNVSDGDKLLVHREDMPAAKQE